jgi:anthranilate synthase component 1
MQITPDFESFAANYAAGRPTLLRAGFVTDLDTPVGAYLKLEPHFRLPAFLLESVEGGATRGRYSIIGLEPDLIWRCSGGRAEIDRRPGQSTGFAPIEAPPLQSLRALIAESAIALDPDLPPMAAGLFGYLGYDMVREMEQLEPAKPDPIGVPDAILIRPTVVLVFDTVKDELSVLLPVRPQSAVTARAAYEAAEDLIDRVARALDAPLAHVATPTALTHAAITPTSNTSVEDYLSMVTSAKEYIRAGDIFQVVLSQRFETGFALPAMQLYRALRRVNPAPFLCFLDFADFQIVVSSPEILVRLRGGEVTIRPIAGTRPRGATPETDRANAADLLADPKERAEHLMLLDLGRNDVGRVAEIGSVTVSESFALEYYSHVMHIVSHVTGRLAAPHDALSALVAGFPAGTVSGAPKIRAMQIIDELERDKRGIYAGCIGYFGAGGDMDTCIALRTAVLKDGRMHVQTGAGIVNDSDPQSEQLECVNKARALFRAAEEAVRYASMARRGQ